VGTIRTVLAAGAATLLLAGAVHGAAGGRICNNSTGMQGGFFYTFWKSGGDACMVLGRGGRYASRYRLAADENLVVGKGWRTGTRDRRVGYRASAFEAGRNSYLALYGWSIDPLVEYYVVENWGDAFTPPGRDTARIGSVTSDGGTYDIFRTRRVMQPSIRGVQTFDQYWSVRRTPRSMGGRATVTFVNHVRAWQAHGMRLGRMDYQVMATEGFGSTGGSDVTIWDD